jgi:SAM-dependent methyltransferase
MGNFTKNDADLWYWRNKEKFLTQDTDPIMKAIRLLPEKPERVLEIGCADGYRLQWIHDEFGSFVGGIEISKDAVGYGFVNYPDVTFLDALNSARIYDLVIFGFCLYLHDVSDLARILYSTDKQLSPGGHIIIWDYYHDGHLFRPYQHAEGVTEHHMEFSKMFTWHPWYKVIRDQDAPEGPVITIRKEINETSR